MYYRLKRNDREKIITKASKMMGGMKNLSLKLKIPKSALYLYYNGKRAINEKNLNKILELSKINLKEESIIEKLPNNYKQILGGKKVVLTKINNGTFEKQMKLCHKGSSKYMKNLHKILKKTKPEEYYKGQYEKFKKMGGYKFTTKNGEKVRNKLELEVANNLKELGLKYKYEQYINIDGKAFFPDFLIDNKIIIECTMWRGYDKAIKLKEKIEFLTKKYKVYVLIPKPLNKYYKILNSHVIFGLDDISPLSSVR